MEDTAATVSLEYSAAHVQLAIYNNCVYLHTLHVVSTLYHAARSIQFHSPAESAPTRSPITAISAGPSLHSRPLARSLTALRSSASTTHHQPLLPRIQIPPVVSDPSFYRVRRTAKLDSASFGITPSLLMSALP
jgi:hypothetical protein